MAPTMGMVDTSDISRQGKGMRRFDWLPRSSSQVNGSHIPLMTSPNNVEKSERQKILEVSSLSLRVQSMWAHTHSHIRVTRQELGWGRDSNHVHHHILGRMCYITIWAAPLFHFPFQKEMMVKREIQERRGNMAKWDAWGQKVSAMTWIWHSNIRIAFLFLLASPWKLAAFVTLSAPKMNEMYFRHEFTHHQRAPMTLTVPRTRRISQAAYLGWAGVGHSRNSRSSGLQKYLRNREF